MAGHELVVRWLNDAYGMEQSQVEMLERFIKDYDAFPFIKAHLMEHLEETKRQIEDVRICIESLGGKVSKSKSILGKMMGSAQGMSTGPFKDEVVRNMLVLHTGEHFEHVKYLTIAYATQAYELNTVADTCIRIADEERRTADWAESQLPDVVKMFLETVKRS